MVTKQNRRRAHAFALRNLDHWLGRHKGPAGAAERTVGYHMDALFRAQVDNFLLRQGWVVFDLVDGRDDGAVGEELFEVSLAVLRRLSVPSRSTRFGVSGYVIDVWSTYVANANPLHLPGREELFHRLPRIDMRMRVHDISLSVWQGREPVMVPLRVHRHRPMLYKSISPGANARCLGV